MLKECVESLLSLSLNNEEFEIILIDDGSDQNPMDYLAKQGNRIKYIRQDNAGLSEARNKGISIANGKYIQFIDGDDTIIKSGYEKCISLLKRNEVDMLIFKLSNKTTESKDNSYRITTGPNHLRDSNIHATACGYLFKKSILHKLRFTKSIYHEDEEFTPLLLLQANRIICTNINAYYYRERPRSITSSKNQHDVIKRITDLKFIIKELNKKVQSFDNEYSLALQRRMHQLTMDYIYKIMIETNEIEYLNKELKDLERLGLFPLPNKKYTIKYSLFRLLSKYKFGQIALIQILPLLKRER